MPEAAVRPRRNQARLAAGLLLVAAMLAGLQLAAPPSDAAVGPCTDVQLIGLRGSGEGMSATEHDMGSLVGPIADAIALQAQGAATVSFHGLPYPAGDASPTTVLSGSYFASKDAGSAMLHAYLAEEIAACPATKLVVMGYSQGAHTAGDRLATEPTSITDHVAALVMFGDPRFNPEASYTWGTFDSRDHGIAGARSLSDFSTWSSRVFSFCNQNDIICQGLGKGHSVGQHKQSLYISNYSALVAGLVRRRLGFPRPASSLTPLDLAFVIDTTGSMGAAITGVTDAAAQIAQTLKANGSDFRVGLVDYKDTDQGDPYASRVDLPMTNDAAAFSTAVKSLTASGGGDTPEAVYSGLMTAIDGLSWRAVPRKAIILMGDAPAKNPEPVTGFTQDGVLAAARALDPAILFPLAVGSGPLGSFQPLADSSGGTVFAAAGAADVSTQIVAAVDQAAIPLYTSLTVSGPSRPGSAVRFSAAASYYDAGEITSYAWDFDGDGVTDDTTTVPRTTHVYAAPFNGTASVTVTTDDGRHGSITAAVDVRGDAPLLPGAPTALTTTTGMDGTSVTAAWRAPADSGGATTIGYEAEVDDAVSGAPSAAVGTDGTSVTLTELTPGRYVVRVAAVTDAGLGPAAEHEIELTAPIFSLDSEPPGPGDRQPRRGFAVIGGTTRCQHGRSFRIRVNGAQISSVVFSLDGRAIKTLTEPNLEAPRREAGYGPRYAVRIRSSVLAAGRHTVRALVSFTSQSVTPPKLVITRFRVCS